MSTPVKMPQLGESVIEGTVLRWLKQPGDAVSKHEPLLEISTDKIDTEVPAPITGVLLEILVEEGATVAAGTLIARLGASGETAAPDATDAPGITDTPTDKLIVTEPPSQQVQRAAPPAETRPAGRTFISPVVARMSAEHDIDLAQVTGTGLSGRITKKDLETYLAEVKREMAEGEEGAAKGEEEQASRDKPADALSNDDDILQPLTTMRRAIAPARTSPASAKLI